METGGEIGRMADEVMTIEELHRKMGHILQEATRCLRLRELKLISQANYGLEIPVNMLKPLGNPLESSVRCLKQRNLAKK